MSEPILLNSNQMAHFAAKGFLRLDAVVPEALNQQFLADIGHIPEDEVNDLASHYGKLMTTGAVPVVNAGVKLYEAYPEQSALHKLINLAEVKGAIQSLVGKSPRFDHHFLHISFPPKFFADNNKTQVSQYYHQDSTIDPRLAFDVQLMYFPHKVEANMGGTRFLPGSHLRRVSEAAIARYQNIRGQERMACEAGTVLLIHSGIWHGGGLNQSEKTRYMFKIRMNPSERQQRLWDDSDLPEDHFEQKPIFWTGGARDPNHIHTILTSPEPWFEADTGRLEFINRARFWRYLLGDDKFDVDYWLTRIENEFI